MAHLRQVTIGAVMVAVAGVGVAFAGLVLLSDLREPLLYFVTENAPALAVLFLTLVPITAIIGPFLLVGLGLGLGQVLFPIRAEARSDWKPSSTGPDDP